MNFNEALSELFFCVVAVLAAMIAWEFFKTRDGKLRVIIIALFITKVWVYGGAMIYYLLLDFGYINKIEAVYIRLILNFPMVIVMLRLWKFIRTKE